MLPQICWVITALFPKHETHGYRSEVHRVSEVPGKWISKRSNGQGESGATQVRIRMLAHLSGLRSYGMWAEPTREVWKIWPPQAACVRLRPTPLSPFSMAEMKVRLSPLASSPLSSKRRRGRPKWSDQLHHLSRGAEQWRGRRGIKTHHTRSLGSFPARQNRKHTLRKACLLSSGTFGLGKEHARYTLEIRHGNQNWVSNWYLPFFFFSLNW